MRDKHGVHPELGHILLWALTTLPKTHQLRTICEEGTYEWRDVKPFSLDDVMHMLNLIEQRLTHEITDSFRGSVVSNQPDIIVEFLAMREDIRAA